MGSIIRPDADGAGDWGVVNGFDVLNEVVTQPSDPDFVTLSFSDPFFGTTQVFEFENLPDTENVVITSITIWYYLEAALVADAASMRVAVDGSYSASQDMHVNAASWGSLTFSFATPAGAGAVEVEITAPTFGKAEGPWELDAVYADVTYTVESGGGGGLTDIIDIARTVTRDVSGPVSGDVSTDPVAT